MEFEKTRIFRIAALGAVLLTGVLFAAVNQVTREQRRAMPHIEIVGGGFIYNYRIAEIRCGIAAVVKRPFPNGTRLVASFENPWGGGPIVVERQVWPASIRYGFETPPLSGVRVDRPYRVALQVISPKGEVIESHEKWLSTRVAPEHIPDRPLTVGPGYHLNPDRQ